MSCYHLTSPCFHKQGLDGYPAIPCAITGTPVAPYLHVQGHLSQLYFSYRSLPVFTNHRLSERCCIRYFVCSTSLYTYILFVFSLFVKYFFQNYFCLCKFKNKCQKLFHTSLFLTMTENTGQPINPFQNLLSFLRQYLW